MKTLATAVLAFCGSGAAWAQDKPKEGPHRRPAGRECECPHEAVKPPPGNNGVGNGVDPQPPGQPPVNDVIESGPGRPGNKPPKDKDKDGKPPKHGDARPDHPDKKGQACECRCHGDAPRPPGDTESRPDHPGKGKDRPKGNNGVGNGEDPQPPGNPPVNDGPGARPGKPGNRGGAKK